MAENKLDDLGLGIFWNYAVSYITANFTLIGTTAMGTVANTITGAIREIVDKIGSVSMGTTATTLTGAIAEHEQDIDTIITAIGNTTMGTTADTITGAIAEHEQDIVDLNSKIGYMYKASQINVTVPAGNSNTRITDKVSLPVGTYIALLKTEKETVFNLELGGVNYGGCVSTNTGLGVFIFTMGGFGEVYGQVLWAGNSRTLTSDSNYYGLTIIRLK